MISIDAPLDLFDKHLSKPDNKQILFSAPFGYGKTFFLKEFFKDHENYRAFWLSPVNYVVGQNEDIFEYIKIDIALQLIKLPEFHRNEEYNFGIDLYIDQYLRNRPWEVAKILIQLIKGCATESLKTGIEVLETLAKAKADFETWKANLDQSLETDYDKLTEFISNNTRVKGSIYENDLITQIIGAALSLVKEQKPCRENVLIIDDFDRLDPEHIFRILNILSAHQPVGQDQNKFGFDKIIVVCSIDNIKKIYQHKYGKEVDFNGYIEKFYSTDIFHFTNQAAIAHHCYTLIDNQLDEEVIVLLQILLSFFVNTNRVTVRSFIKYNKFQKPTTFSLGTFRFPKRSKDNIGNTRVWVTLEGGYEQSYKVLWASNFDNPIKEGVAHFNIDNKEFNVFEVIIILNTVFGDYNAFLNTLRDCRKQSIDIPEDYIESITRAILPLMHLVNNYDNHTELFGYDFGKNINNNSGERVFAFARPTILLHTQYLPVEYHIPLLWGKDNQYDGTKNYYALDKSVVLSDKNRPEIKAHIQSNLFKYLLDIVLFLETKGFLKHLGISA
jgi:hypothetical protein